MGCDIHLFIEEDAGKIDTKPWWCLRANPFIWRDYLLFGVLAGARVEDIEHIAPRGLPPDLDSETDAAAQTWNGDAHTHSWLSAREFTDACQRYHEEAERRHWDCNSGRTRQVHALAAFVSHIAGENPDGARVVLWFDN